jgi:hypothetical protein
MYMALRGYLHEKAFSTAGAGSYLRLDSGNWRPIIEAASPDVGLKLNSSASTGERARRL